MHVYQLMHAHTHTLRPLSILLILKPCPLHSSRPLAVLPPQVTVIMKLRDDCARLRAEAAERDSRVHRRAEASERRDFPDQAQDLSRFVLGDPAPGQGLDVGRTTPSLAQPVLSASPASEPQPREDDLPALVARLTRENASLTVRPNV